MSTVPLISARGLVLVRDGRRILDNVDFSVAAGEIVTIVGPNGSGKTTLVRVLAGLETAGEGVLERSPGLRIGWLPQRLHVDRILPLTVYRLLSLTGRIREQEARTALEEAGVAHLFRARVQDLSGGEFQRVMLARTLLSRPHLLILDEPAQGVDYRGQTDLYDLIARLRTVHGCAVVMISHDLHVVMAATDRVVCLHHHVCCVGHPRMVARDPVWERLFGPEAAGHIAWYGHEGHHHHHNPDGTISADCSVHGHEAHTGPVPKDMK
ncbi:metal ABC transporter ATP-binding protein [Haematospirillum jordaniae]|uniref:Zinc ABC transporter ATP-binding protein n=1 Tax=Haematospirillum jordaniae TaxID=1549855 RepID=A0A143DEN4_9PROT|nr:metal ABC transporter ATP-binding protein [Haematospirillum jordaniae]AMW34578.1 zinc ABC transporter ATP-binding protein [Haematospirillum jordaniae]NKD46202.1 metal ABC transporter ATP-binding protein [Haematospirillum jordaniae]NKD58104.1 metal ABC transporter ATP-binding protein [Haematospirillum jordaniae]NKD60229.1 metal ABC transporter ATP-binding protein [Haematospirillum jordaniae]NKD68153.1 metal ABC transporter ATP-binding protein [Haematospirillum jordaniae]